MDPETSAQVTNIRAPPLLNGSADMPIRFEKAFGVKADTMLRMQAAYELAEARKGGKPD